MTHHAAESHFCPQADRLLEPPIPVQRWRAWRSALVIVLLVVGSAVGLRSNAAADPPAVADYARRDLLIDATELTTPATRLLLDARTAEKFQALHLKDAVNVIGNDWSNDFGDGQDPTAWNHRFGQLGITQDTEVIVYDDRAGQDAARIWWYLRYWGVSRVKIVNGGWKSIQAAGLPTQDGASRAPAPTNFKAAPAAEQRIDLTTLVQLHRDGRVGSAQPDHIQLIDVRSQKEFQGEQTAEGQRPGTIPGARHLEWSDLVDASTERFKPTAEVLALIQERGIQFSRPIVVFSNTRGRSSSIVFPLKLAGAADTRVFESGIKSWGLDPSNPIQIPQEP